MVRHFQLEDWRFLATSVLVLAFVSVDGGSYGAVTFSESLGSARTQWIEPRSTTRGGPR